MWLNVSSCDSKETIKHNTSKHIAYLYPKTFLNNIILG